MGIFRRKVVEQCFNLVERRKCEKENIRRKKWINYRPRAKYEGR